MRPTGKPTPTSFLPLATAFETLSQRRSAGGIDAVAVQRALSLRSLFLAERLLVALGGAHRRFETPEEFITVAQKAHPRSAAWCPAAVTGSGWAFEANGSDCGA